MSKQIAIIPLSDIKRIAIIEGQGQSLTQIKGSADYVINGGFFDWDTGKPTNHLKINGKVLAKESWNAWGFRWETGSDICMDVIPGSGGRNYICGTELITKSNSNLTYPKDQGGSRGRTAIGVAPGKLVLFCSNDGTKDSMTPEKLRDEMKSFGCTGAIMLDGGGSSQCDFPTGKISSMRRVHNYIAVWLKKKEGTSVTKKVVLDAGHGSETAGKRSPDETYFEHEFNLDMANRVKAHLERHGVGVTMTRTDNTDLSLATRVKIANQAEPDLFVSLHSNASGNDWSAPRGLGIYTSMASDTAGRNKAAKAILKRAEEAGIQLWGGGLHHDSTLYVLKNTDAPAVLIEHGFHTNLEEVELLKTPSYRDLLASVDTKGILDYLGIPWVDKPVEVTVERCVCPWCGGKLKIEKG